MKQLLILSIGLGMAMSARSQFSGGSGRGDARLENDATSLAGEDLNVLFSGGSGNGQTRATAALSVLPINLLRFEARADGDAALLGWTAVSDPGEGFEVQRASGSGPWQTLASVPGTGDGQSALAYSYRDARPAGRVQYYRLVLLNRTGGVRHSPTARVVFGEGGVRIYPTVTTGTLVIDRPAGGATELRIWGAQGQLVERRMLPGGRVEVSIERLSAGVYFLQVGEGERVRVVKG